MQILTTKGQILKFAISGVFGLVSGLISLKNPAPAVAGQGAGVPRFTRLWYLPVSARFRVYLTLNLKLQHLYISLNSTQAKPPSAS
jgi:hypothetical protein